MAGPAGVRVAAALSSRVAAPATAAAAAAATQAVAQSTGGGGGGKAAAATFGVLFGLTAGSVAYFGALFARIATRWHVCSCMSVRMFRAGRGLPVAAICVQSFCNLILLIYILFHFVPQGAPLDKSDPLTVRCVRLFFSE